jgi:hypothetical protein
MDHGVRSAVAAAAGPAPVIVAKGAAGDRWWFYGQGVAGDGGGVAAAGSAVRPVVLRWTVRRLLLVGYLAAMVALGLVAANAYLRIGALLADRVPVEHSYEVLGRIAQVRADIKDAERSQRGYVITGADSYLQPYQRAVAAIGDNVTVLRRLRATDAPMPDIHLGPAGPSGRRGS